MNSSCPPADQSDAPVDIRLVAACRRVHSATAVAVMVVAATVVAGWLLDVPALRSIRPGWASMKVNTALGLFMAGAALWLLRTGGGGWRKRLAGLLATLVALLGAANLAQQFFDWNLGIDELLVQDATPALFTTHPGRMSVNSALSLLFSGLALVLIDRQTGHGRHPAEWLVVAAATPAFLALVGYAYGLHVITGLFNSAAMALHTAVAFLLLAAGILAARPETGFMRWFVNRGITGIAARVLLPGSIGLMVVVGFLAALGAQWGLYGPATCGALLLVTGIGALIFFFSRTIPRLAGLEALYRTTLAELSERSAALHRSETRLQTLIDHAPADLAMFDRDMRYLAVSRRWLEHYRPGGEDMDILGRSHYEVFPDIPEAWKEAHRRGLAGEVLSADADRFERADGSVQWVRWEIRPWHDETGAVGGIVIFAEEITRQMEAQEALRRSRELLGLITDAVPALISYVDADYRYRLVNLGYQRWFGLPPEEIVGQPLRDVLGGAAWETLHPWMERALAGEAVSFEQEVPYREGGLRWVQVSYTPDRDELGRVRGFAVLVQDISERKKAEEALRISEARFRRMADSAPVMIWMSGTDKGCTWFNRPWLEFTGRSLEQEVGTGWTEGVHPDDLDGCLQTYETAFDRVEPFAMEYRLRRHDGESRWIFDRGVPYFDGDRKLTGYIGSCFDITERKAAAAEILRLNAELEQRVQELEHSNEALLHSNMELQHFAHATAHDLQTPLRSIAGFAQLLQHEVQGQANEHVDELASLVIDNTKRLHTLIQELLAYTRLDSLGRPFEAVDLRDVADEVIASLAALTHETGAEIRCEHLPTLSVDRTQFAQVLKNLIENGIKYNQSKPPQVSIASEFQEDKWVFSVADNGIGIDPRHHERIFEIFRRLHTYSQVPGTGIGLAICRRIVERHGGHIWAESRPGRGSTFYFTLPARNP